VKTLIKAINRVTPALPLVKALNWFLRRVVYGSHAVQFALEWGGNNPEYFDHHIDQYYLWRKRANSFMWERGVFGSIAIAPGDRVLDLCCGDGFFTFHFYSTNAAEIIGIDFDERAVRGARRNFRRDNLSFAVADIRDSLPDGPFDVVVWDAAIEHFTESEIGEILRRIAVLLGDSGVLAGYTIVATDDGQKHLDQHEYEFSSAAELDLLLRAFFRNVQVIKTSSAERDNLYFHASNGPLPLSEASLGGT